VGPAVLGTASDHAKCVKRGKSTQRFHSLRSRPPHPGRQRWSRDRRPGSLADMSRPLVLALALTAALAAALTAAPTAWGHPPSHASQTHAWAPPLASGFSGLQLGFERPHNRFAPGHRGVDLSAPVGTPVYAVGPGVVTFTGEVARVPIITITHERTHATTVRSSYLPVDSLVRVGDEVVTGQRIGQVSARGKHCPVSCLHLGLRQTLWEQPDSTTDPYLDPIAWIQRIPVLKPER
jgi:murein DD-endopeptidase MepM/ murein hydrolase activator NlpD